MDLLAVYALRMSAAMAVTLVNVLIKNGVKIVLVPSKKGYQIVFYVKLIVKRDF